MQEAANDPERRALGTEISDPQIGEPTETDDRLQTATAGVEGMQTISGAADTMAVVTRLEITKSERQSTAMQDLMNTAGTTADTGSAAR